MRGKLTGQGQCKKSLIGASKKTLKAAASRLSKEKTRIRHDLSQLRAVQQQLDKETLNENDD